MTEPLTDADLAAIKNSLSEGIYPTGLEIKKVVAEIERLKAMLDTTDSRPSSGMLDTSMPPVGFRACDTCRQRLEGLPLCAGCLHNRAVIAVLEKEKGELCEVREHYRIMRRNWEQEEKRLRQALEAKP